MMIYKGGGGAGAVAEWSKALPLREKTKSSQVCVPALKTMN